MRKYGIHYYTQLLAEKSVWSHYSNTLEYSEVLSLLTTSERARLEARYHHSYKLKILL